MLEFEGDLDLRWEGQLLLKDVLEHLVGVLLIEGREAKHHLVKQCAHAVEVDAPVVTPLDNHLRGHVPFIFKPTQNFRRRSKRARPAPDSWRARSPRSSGSPTGPGARSPASGPDTRSCCGASTTSLNKFR